jgi:hypothetical protein
MRTEKVQETKEPINQAPIAVTRQKLWQQSNWKGGGATGMGNGGAAEMGDGGAAVTKWLPKWYIHIIYSTHRK